MDQIEFDTPIEELCYFTDQINQLKIILNDDDMQQNF